MARSHSVSRSACTRGVQLSRQRTRQRRSRARRASVRCACGSACGSCSPSSQPRGYKKVSRDDVVRLVVFCRAASLCAPNSAGAAASARRVAHMRAQTRLPCQLSAVLHHLRRGGAAGHVRAVTAHSATRSVARRMRCPRAALGCMLPRHSRPAAAVSGRRARYDCLQSGPYAEAPASRRAGRGWTRLIHHRPFLRVFARDLQHGAGSDMRCSGFGGDVKWHRRTPLASALPPQSRARRSSAMAYLGPRSTSPVHLMVRVLSRPCVASAAPRR